MQLTSVQKMYFHFDQVEWELGRGFYSLIEQYMHSITSYKKVNGIFRKQQTFWLICR